MLDKMLGVSPPPKGETPDSKALLSKDFRGTSKSDYKREFEKTLHSKMDHKKIDLENKKEADRKEAKSREEELRAARKDNKDKKSLGGTKKKVTDDDKMVSNVMASNESKVEIPDSKTEQPAEIEVDITQKLKADLAELNVLQKPEGAEQAAQATAVDKADETAKEGAEGSTPMQNLEAELGAAVDFKSDAGLQQSSKELAQKVKAFEADKNPATEKANSFEQSVLDRLQKDLSVNPGQLSDKNQSGSEQNSDPHNKDLKADLLTGNQLHQAAGQSHSDFKNHLSTVGAGAADAQSANKLEDNRDANIKEVMNQAQYLVKKGGGEMTVKMSPEGLGEVHLRVLLQDGKLNIEMQTQDKDVKKLIEESLSDLKSGLAAHRLSLEHVKIDNVNATNADNNTQFQSNLNHGGSQERARENWNDFQSNMNNQSQARGPREAAGATSLAPRTASAASMGASAALRTYGGTKGASINRVA
jgi:flagellar hook-length control protein FliK